jgi:hypothetical protein
MPRDPDATPYSWIPHRGWPSQGYSTTVVPRSEALLGPLMLLIMPLDRSHPRAWGASSPTGLGPRHTTCPHNDRGLTAVCHISKSNERAGPRLSARGGWPILAGNTWSPKIADPPSNRRHRAFRIAVLAREVAEGLAGVPRCGGGGADAGYIEGGRASDRSMRGLSKNRLARYSTGLEGTIYSGRVRSPRSR